jgi:radical S-adenosyl methionine domain-containing protein 2
MFYIIIIFILSSLYIFKETINYIWFKEVISTANKGIVINFHFLRECNYKCKFCFHTNKDRHVETLERIKKGLSNLKSYMKEDIDRVNFSGGEPFLKQKLLGEMCKFCHNELRIKTSIVSNGSKITEKWFHNYGKYLDILAISCDSFEPDTLKKIGRYEKKTDHIQQLKQIRRLCYKYNIIFKINTVVCSVNKDEIMVNEINSLKPKRWKVFQCLLIHGENTGDGDIRDAREMVVSKDEFETFIKHNHTDCIVPENNDAMRNSYYILDEKLRFLNNQNGKKEPTVSILDNIGEAIKSSGFCAKTFESRGGKWSQEIIVKDIEDY